MIQEMMLSPGVVLRHCPDNRFKKCALSIQLLRPMDDGEAAQNALIPAVLLRGTERHPDLRAITWRLDELYGAGVNAMVRRIGDVQTVGFYMSLMEDRFAQGGSVLAPGVDFLRELMLMPLTVDGGFDPEIVDSEKKNLISAIASELNDKRTYTAAQMIRKMCPGDSFAVPRLGRAEAVTAVDAKGLYDHYQRILAESQVEFFYVGSASAEAVAELLMPFVKALGTSAQPMKDQTAFVPTVEPGEYIEEMDVNQGKLSMGFTTSITNRHPDFAAMQVFNAVYGAGATSKLFQNVREKMSLCYYASSSYYGSKGIVTVSSGIDEENFDQAKGEILHQLSLCAQGQITEAELSAGKSAIISALRSTPDSPGSLEGYYATVGISGAELDIPDYIAQVERVCIADVDRCARAVKLHTVYFLKGVSA